MATVATPMSPMTTRQAEPMSSAYKWLVLFFVVYCARPEDWIPGMAVLPLAKITGFFALATFGLSVGRSRRGVLRLPREILYLVLLFGQLCLAVVSPPYGVVAPFKSSSTSSRRWF